MIYKRQNRIFWIQRGFASLLDGIITLITFGNWDGGYAIYMAEKTLMHAMRERQRKENEKLKR